MAVVALPRAGDAGTSKSLRWSFSWTLLGDVIYAACQWGMLIALAKLGTPEMVGQLALGFAVTAPVIILANLTLRPILATDIVGEYCFGDYFVLRLFTTAIALLVIMGIALLAGYPRGTVLVILAVGLAKAMEAMSDVYHGLLQRHEQLDRIAKSKILKGLLSVMAFTLCVHATRDVAWGVMGLTGAGVLVLLLYDARYGAMVLDDTGRGTGIWRQWDSRRVYKLVRLTLPLGVATMFVSLNDAIPRYVIEQYLGTTALGIYAAIAYLPAAGMMVVNAFGQSAVTRLAKYYAEPTQRQFTRLLFRMTGVAAAVGGAGVLAVFVGGRDLLTLAYQAQYADRTDVFLWLMCVSTIGYMASIIGFGLIAARLLTVQPLVLAASSIVGVVCSYAWIPTFGITGAASAYGASFLTQLIGFLVCTVLYSRPASPVDAPPRESLSAGLIR